MKEYGERPIDDGNEPDAPRIRRPYPLLKVDEGVECPESRMYGCFDEGSEHGDPIPVEGEDKKVKVEETGDKTEVGSPNPGRGYIYKGEDGSIHRSLEEHIPEQFFSDRLVITDPLCLAFGKGPIREPEHEPWIYKRVYPTFPRDSLGDLSTKDPVATELHLDPDERIGSGSHSHVYRATLTLPKGLSARTPDGKVTVAAKTSFPLSYDRLMFRNEGEIFSSFPKHLSEEWCGYNMVSPLSSPVPIGQVVPKFYGYYEPTGERRDALSPILLMEECGTPVDADKLTSEQK